MSTASFKKDAENELLKPLKENCNNGIKDDVEFEDVLKLVGSQGRFQKIFLYGILTPLIILRPLFIANMIFIFFVPDHWCLVPGRDNVTDIDTWKNFTLPKEVGPDGKFRFSQCSMYNPDNLTEIQSCTNGWEYDKTDYESTLPSAYDWVCTKLSYSTNSLSIFAVGNAVGTIIFGSAADKFGRKPIFFITCFINIISRMISLFVPHIYGLFLLCQFIVGSAVPMMAISAQMILIETCDKEYRSWVYSMNYAVYVIGMCIMALLAYLLRDWFSIGFTSSITGLFFIFYFRTFKESPRWLISSGRIPEAKEILLHIAKTNGNTDKVTPASLDIMLEKIGAKMAKEKRQKTGFWTLFAKPRLRKHTILLTVSWCTNIIIYYGLNLNTQNMSGNQFINFFLISIFELPAGLSGGYLAERVGRRWLNVLFYFFVSVTCWLAALTVVYEHLSTLVIVLVIMAKFSITVTDLVMNMQSAELFPTQLRSTGIGFASTIGLAAGTIGPFIIYLGRFNASGPYLIMGGISFLSMIFASFLPETLKASLPQTLEEANDFGQFNKYWSLQPKNLKKLNNCGQTTKRNSLST